MQGLRAVRGRLSGPLSGSSRGPESPGLHGRTVSGGRLHRLQHMLLRLPGTRGAAGVSAGKASGAKERARWAMPKQLIKGNVAAVKGALLAGCRAFYGYPITPASEIAEAAAEYFPRRGGVFLQAESEVAAINMVYGASGTGTRVMTASSGPGLSLMQEGISYLAGAELPCVIIDVMRAGPGLGNIAPEQSDYFQIVKGGGHGSYRNIVLAPNSAQEMCNFTMRAFEIADR